MARQFRVHPALGVARVGDSPDGFFIGPERPAVPANWNAATHAFESFRDSAGKVKRQAARFRVFEYVSAADGTFVPKEIVSGQDGVKEIEWRVHIANRKGSFFTFNGQSGAEDLFVARASRAASAPEKDDPARTNLRNSTVTGDRSAQLDIDPGEVLIVGLRQGPVRLTNHNAAAIPIPDLGELRTDEAGRLLVLGGHGTSRSTATLPVAIDEYANNDTWFDDVGDGSVKARVFFDDGAHVDADAAWVSVGPPDFAPAVGNVVSLYDTMWDLAVRHPEITIPVDNAVFQAEPIRRLSAQRAAWQASGGQSLNGYRPSFTGEIYPILARALGARGVHQPLTNPDFHKTFQESQLGALADAAHAGARQRILDRIRDPKSNEVNYAQMPRGLGDLYDDLDNDHPTARSFLSLTHVQYAVLERWAAGEFESDWPGEVPAVPDAAPITPEGLDRAATESCVGGPFYPGIEVSWLVRETALYAEPFRLRVSRRPDGEPQDPVQPTIGAVPFRPGFFTQQMAQPWQADFYDCHKELHQDPGGVEAYYMWWTAQRPDDVTPRGSTAGRVRWVRGLAPNASDPSFDDDPNIERFASMVRNWSRLGFVVRIGEDLVEDEAL
jgi:hypothetical protein